MGMSAERVSALCLVVVLAAVSRADEVEEVVVIGKLDQSSPEVVANWMLDTHLANDRGRALYLQHRYAEAAPYLAAAAKRGFKMAQARLGEILVLGLDGVPQDVAAGMGWLGVAAEGTTMPSVRNRFGELREHVPAALQARLDEVVARYVEQYGSEATEVDCRRYKAAGTHLTKIACEFRDQWKYGQYFGVDAAEAVGVVQAAEAAQAATRAAGR